MIMSSLKLVLDIGLEFIPGVGEVLSAGLGRSSSLFETQQLIRYE